MALLPPGCVTDHEENSALKFEGRCDQSGVKKCMCEKQRWISASASRGGGVKSASAPPRERVLLRRRRWRAGSARAHQRNSAGDLKFTLLWIQIQSTCFDATVRASNEGPERALPFDLESNFCLQISATRVCGAYATGRTNLSLWLPACKLPSPSDVGTVVRQKRADLAVFAHARSNIEYLGGSKALINMHKKGRPLFCTYHTKVFDVKHVNKIILCKREISSNSNMTFNN